ncbi:unnamed protein product [Trichogramma brassicae]|uniref:Uncharacterized protein n=1 Tax=Trichogramma brassicae TaxID=86971 RepID=A0A6H5I171_9HYME|nr:unnamed protein product [Trichogramma brassicae]
MFRNTFRAHSCRGLSRKVRPIIWTRSCLAAQRSRHVYKVQRGSRANEELGCSRIRGECNAVVQWTSTQKPCCTFCWPACAAPRERERDHANRMSPLPVSCFSPARDSPQLYSCAMRPDADAQRSRECSRFGGRRGSLGGRGPRQGVHLGSAGVQRGRGRSSIQRYLSAHHAERGRHRRPGGVRQIRVSGVRCSKYPSCIPPNKFFFSSFCRTKIDRLRYPSFERAQLLQH